MHKLEINSRRIIPIRAIPIVTGRDIPPDDLVTMLAHGSLHYRPSVSLESFHLEQDGVFYQMQPRDWDHVRKDLRTLSSSLLSQEKVPDENHAKWREEATRLIPPGTFVWWDDFESAYEEVFSKRLAVQVSRRLGTGEINENPQMGTVIQNLIYEGFESLLPKRDEEIRVPTQREIRRANLIKRNEDLRKQARALEKKQPDKSNRWIAKRLAKTLANPLAEVTIRQIIRKKNG